MTPPNDVESFLKECELVLQDPDKYISPLDYRRNVPRLLRLVRRYREALQWIDKPDHFEPDQYTQTACFQHRAYEALKYYGLEE